MKLISRSFFLMLLFFLLFSCASLDKGPLEPENSESSLVFGYLDMSEAKGRMDWVQMIQLQPETDKPYYRHYVEKGLFWHPRVNPGVYKLDSFGGSGGIRIGRVALFSNTTYEYNFPRQGQGVLDVSIESTGLYFVGAYKVKIEKGGFLKQDKFEIVPIEHPTEKDLLEQLLSQDKNGAWRSEIEKRLAELR